MNRQNGNGSGEKKPVLVLGGSGFIGTNLAHRLLSDGTPVVIFDNLSRPGVERNLRWLLDTHGNQVRVEVGDVRDAASVRRVVQGVERVFHFAAQVAVTTSVLDPASDFEVNARGTINVLEAIRAQETPPALLYTSTNKVYGGLDDVDVRVNGQRYEPADEALRRRGIGEARGLAFHSPYGCSKGAAEQYVLDYARTYGLHTLVFRMSCIYGPHQFGTEDQGWVAHFLLRALEGQPITLYGNGMQVRDVLFVEDLVDAFELGMANVRKLSGRAFNIGGGPERTTSLLELLRLMGELSGTKIDFRLEDWRIGDQRYYVSDTTAFQRATGWQPRTSVQEGVARLWTWLRENRRAHEGERVLLGAPAPR